MMFTPITSVRSLHPGQIGGADPCGHDRDVTGNPITGYETFFRFFRLISHFAEEASCRVGEAAETRVDVSVGVRRTTPATTLPLDGRVSPPGERICELSEKSEESPRPAHSASKRPGRPPVPFTPFLACPSSPRSRPGSPWTRRASNIMVTRSAASRVYRLSSPSRQTCTDVRCWRDGLEDAGYRPVKRADPD
jgi:hypothetical protein